MSAIIDTEVLVLGSGPGGYSAAFRAADLGLDVMMVERYDTLGGVCLNVGCIPSKALLHVARVIAEIKESSGIGVRVGEPEIDIDAVRAFKDAAVSRLVKGVGSMARQRSVKTLQGEGRFTGTHELEVTQGQVKTRVRFKHAIIAAGSRPVKLPFMPQNDPRIWDSTDALALSSIPERLLVIGGGIIGMEMATVYQALGSRITIVEYADQLIPAADKDLVRVYQRYNQELFDVRLETRVIHVQAREDSLQVTLCPNSGGESIESFDAILLAVGRKPNGGDIGAEPAGVFVDERGFIPVDHQLRTNVSHIFAIGDINGDPMLAHKATHEGHVAAEVIAGHNVSFQPLAIPSIAYTNPEIAWTGLTEKQARAQGISYAVSVFPWSASGRAIGEARSEGKTKLIHHAETGVLLGAGIVGINAGELLGELSLAIEFKASVEDLALTIHAHPTLHETVGLAAELASGTITDLPNPAARLKVR